MPEAPRPTPGDLAPRAPEPMPEGTPETGDRVDPDDLDAVLTAGESVHGTLTSRLSDLGT